MTAGFEAYEEALRKRRMLDLDDVLIRSADLIHDDVGFAERAHWRYRHLSVDEFQDVNPAQFRLITALTGARVDLCAVGDRTRPSTGGTVPTTASSIACRSWSPAWRSCDWARTIGRPRRWWQPPAPPWDPR